MQRGALSQIDGVSENLASDLAVQIVERSLGHHKVERTSAYDRT